jgi:hypothetical protein
MADINVAKNVILGKRERRPTRTTHILPAPTQAVPKLKRSQKFMNALGEMRTCGLGDGHVDKKRRRSIYIKHGLDSTQWSQCYLAHKKMLPSATLIHRQVAAEISSLSATTTSTPSATEPKKRRTIKTQLHEADLRKEAHKAATSYMTKNDVSSTAAVKFITSLGTYGTNVPSRGSLDYHFRQNREGGESPPRTGLASKIPRKVLTALAEKIKYLAGRGYNMNKKEIIAQLLIVTKDTELGEWYEDKQYGGTRCQRWYYQFLNDPVFGLSKGAALPAEKARTEWTTAKNVGRHYDLLEKWFEVAGVGGWYLDGTQVSKQAGATFKVTDPGRIVSFDETACVLSQVDDYQNTVGSRGVKKQTSVSKSSARCTGVATNLATGAHLTPFFIWSCGKTENFFDVWIKGGPTSTAVDPSTSKPYEAMHEANKKGTMNNAMTIPYLNACIMPHFPNLTEDHPLVMICDGHGSHLTWELIQWARENNVMILLRPPHTTHVTQGEDVHGFGLFKKDFANEKAHFMNDLRAKIEQAKSNGNNTANMKNDLHWSDLMTLIRQPWQNAFSPMNVLKAWAKIGIVPFTRCVEHRLRTKEEAAKKATDDRKKVTNELMRNLVRGNLISGTTSSSSPASSSSSSSSSGSANTTTLDTTNDVSSPTANDGHGNDVGEGNNNDDEEDGAGSDDEDNTGGDGARATKKRDKNRSSSKWWGTGPITHGQAYVQRQEFELADKIKCDEANAKSVERAKKNTIKVNELKLKGAAILAAGTCFTTLNMGALKEVLAHYEIYPNRKPATKYATGRAGLLHQLIEKCSAGGNPPPGAAIAIAAEAAAAAVPAPPAT